MTEVNLPPPDPQFNMAGSVASLNCQFPAEPGSTRKCGLPKVVPLGSKTPRCMVHEPMEAFLEAAGAYESGAAQAAADAAT